MKSGIRYTLIASGIIIFAIAAPLLVLFISGVRYDFSSHSFIQTGILSAKTNPKGATVYLNDKNVGKTPISVRFLDPGDYKISLQKTGYFSWDKRLNIKRSYVTNTNLNLSTITLYYSSPKITTIGDNVLDFYLGSRRLIYLTSSTLYLADASTPQKTENLKLGVELKNPQIVAAPSESYYLITDGSSVFVFDVNQNVLKDITKLVAPSENLQITSDGRIFSIQDNDLVQILWRSSGIQTLVKNVLAYTYDDRTNMYILTAEGASINLKLLDLSTNQQSLLIENLPNWNSAKLYYGQQQQIFVNADGALYYVGQTLTPIASYVKDIKFYGEFGKMLYATNNEIDLYDSFDNSSSLITRTGQEIKNPLADLGAGYIFFAGDGRIQNIELDSRDHQNNYSFANISSNAKFYLSTDGTTIFLLDSEKLETLKIH